VGHDAWGLSDTIHHIAAVKASLKSESDKYVFVQSVDEILRAKEQGKLAASFHFQGVEALDGDSNLVELYYHLGVRHMLLAYNQKNRACDGCHERTDCGLSRFGVKVVEEMNRVGMLLDLSHTGYRSTMEAMEVSESPVMFSHSNPFTLKEHPRNIRDDQIKACSKSGGVIGIVGMGPFFIDNEPSPENFAQAIDYVAELVGPQHVAIGLDFVYYPDQMFRKVLANPERYTRSCYPPNPEDWKYLPPEELPHVTEALLKLKYSENDIRGILGENFLRIARQVWK
jgi:membrane dipeptidase